MALPGDQNPFIKILSEKPPIVFGTTNQKTFNRIPLSTGIKINDSKEQSLSSPSNYMELIKTETEATVQQPDSNQIATVQQPDSNQIANVQQPDSNRIATEYKTVQQPDSNQIANQIANGIAAVQQKNILKQNDFFATTGKERQLLITIYDEIISWNNQQTREIRTSELEIILGIKRKQIANVIHRLEEKQLLRVVKSLAAKGGWRIFEVPTNVFLQMKEYRILLKTNQQTGEQRDSNLLANGIANGIAIGSSKLVSNNKELTKLDQKPIEDDFLVPADLDLLQVASFGITRKHVQDLKNQKLNFTTSTLQDFINRFAEYAKDPKNIKNIQSVPAIFCKMAQLASKGEDPLIDIETDVDRLIRERIERLKTKREDRIKQQTELIELEFENWMAEIKTTGQDQLVKPTALMKSGSIGQKMTLKNHFIEQIWPEKAKEFGL